VVKIRSKSISLGEFVDDDPDIYFYMRNAIGLFLWDLVDDPTFYAEVTKGY
jgi:hypothetical protein